VYVYSTAYGYACLYAHNNAYIEFTLWISIIERIEKPLLHALISAYIDTSLWMSIVERIKEPLYMLALVPMYMLIVVPILTPFTT
jgi:hypothetical protein